MIHSVCYRFTTMRNRRLLFFSVVAVVLTAVSALSIVVLPKNHFVCNALHSYRHDPAPSTAGIAITSFRRSHMSPCSLQMATSSSDLKNDVEHTQALTKPADESVGNEEKQFNKDVEKKKHEQSKKFVEIGNNVVSRLAKAAKEAAVAKKKKARNENKKARSGVGVSYSDSISSDDLRYDDDVQSFEDDDDTNVNQEDLSSITKLSNVIDEELLRPTDGYKPSRETDSIRVLLEHNNNQNQKSSHPTFNKSIISSASSSSSKLQKNGKSYDESLAQNEVAIVFARPLSEDQITVEYAVRLVSLAKAMKFEGYNPDLICFCGPASSSTRTTATVDTTEAKHRTSTSIGVEFFRQLCSVNDISLENTNLCRVPDLSSATATKTKSLHYEKDSHDGSDQSTFSNQHASSSFSSSWSPLSLSPVVKKLIDKQYIEKWLEESEAYESDMDEYGMTRQEPRKKIHIHWKLFSTEYHLCNLNDIHIRSPRQSPLARLMHDLEHAASSENYRRGIIQTTWSFHYSIYPYVVSSNKDRMKEAFLGKCYLMAQSLVPLLINLKGVAENSEFFQRDNYRTLVATRRSLATLLEQMNEAYRNNRERQTASMVIPPTLKAQLKKQTSGSSTTISSIEIHLECALLSLGRCCDLVRPAGTFSEQSVSRQQWKDALLHLQEFMDRIECSCDPDRPVPADKWGGELSENCPAMEFLL